MQKQPQQCAYRRACNAAHGQKNNGRDWREILSLSLYLLASEKISIKLQRGYVPRVGSDSQSGFLAASTDVPNKLGGSGQVKRNTIHLPPQSRCSLQVRGNIRVHL